MDFTIVAKNNNVRFIPYMGWISGSGDTPAFGHTYYRLVSGLVDKFVAEQPASTVTHVDIEYDDGTLYGQYTIYNGKVSEWCHVNSDGSRGGMTLFED